MKVVPSTRTIALMFIAAALFAFNAVVAFRMGSTGRAGFYGVMTLLWAALGGALVLKRRTG